MAIIEVKEKIESATAKLDKQRQATYTRVIQVIADDYRTRPGAAIIAAGFQIGEAYKVLDPADGVTVLEEDGASFVQEISAALASSAEDGRQWDVTVSYGPLGGDSAAFPANPIDHPIKISWGSARYEKTAEFDRDGKAITNSAGDYFDPPITVDDSRPVLKIVRNEPTYNALLAKSWKDKTNKGVWFDFDVGTVKAGDFTGELSYNAECGFFYIVSYEFEINPDGWKKQVLDQGMRTLDPDTGKQSAILDDKGQPVSSPVLLDGNGQKLASGDDPVPLEFEIYEEADYDALNFDFASAPGYTS